MARSRTRTLLSSMAALWILLQADPSPDVGVKENDIVMVPLSGTKGFLIELRETIKGLVGFGYTIY